MMQVNSNSIMGVSR